MLYSKPVDGWVIRTCMYHIECPLLLDTGAAVSLIDHQTYLSITASHCLQLHPSHTQLHATDGCQKKLFGETTLELTFNEVHIPQGVMVTNLRGRVRLIALEFLREH